MPNVPPAVNREEYIAALQGRPDPSATEEAAADVQAAADAQAAAQQQAAAEQQAAAMQQQQHQYSKLLTFRTQVFLNLFTKHLI